jgi:hypothetical protein
LPTQFASKQDVTIIRNELLKNIDDVLVEQLEMKTQWAKK